MCLQALPDFGSCDCASSIAGPKNFTSPFIIVTKSFKNCVICDPQNTLQARASSKEAGNFETSPLLNAASHLRSGSEVAERTHAAGIASAHWIEGFIN
jgi:hypothetical protein